ncbi:MAG: extracellular solute-binding protein, partial [Nakamurella sp.]
MKKTLALPAALVAAFVLTACGTGGAGSDSAAAPTTLATTAAVSGNVTFWHAYSAGGGEIKALEDTVIPAFEAKYPGTTVTAVQIPDSDMHQKLVTGVAGGALPDVIRADIVTVPELASLKVLLPLN